jgi:hypothetical protein
MKGIQMDQRLKEINDIIARGNNRDPREVSSRENAHFSPLPREVYKEENNKRINYISRSSEETHPLEVSGETYLLASGTSDHDFVSTSLGEETSKPQDAFVSKITPPRELTSRTFTGISAQHNKSKKGVKISITLQTKDDAEQGLVKTLTAELKRHDRIRELKPYEFDTEFFADFYQQAKESIKAEEDPEYRRSVCMGRLHERGKRSAWVANMIVVGMLDANDIITAIKFFYNEELYEIKLDTELSERQLQSYHSGGLYGNLRSIIQAPTLATIKSQPFRP